MLRNSPDYIILNRFNMKQVTLHNNWLESWKYSYPYDLMEIYGEKANTGYAYAYANRRQHTIKLVQKVAPKGAKILDVAAAQGNFSLFLAELGYKVTWNDLRKELIDYVKLKYEHGIINFAPGNVFELGFENEFDVVLITEIIEHVAYPDKFLRKISQMVKPGGHIVMSTPNGEYFRNTLPRFSDCPDPSQFEKIQFKPDADGHIFLLHQHEIKTIAKEANLTVKEIKIVNNFLSNGHLKLRTILNFIPSSWINTFERFTNSMPFLFRKKLHNCTIALLSRP